MGTKLPVKKLRLKQDSNLECGGVVGGIEWGEGSATFRKSKRIKGFWAGFKATIESIQEISD